MSFIADLVKRIDYEGAHLLDDGENSAEISDYINTGSYMLNALLSGSLYGGLSGNRVTCFAGETSVGKTFFTLDILHKFMADSLEGIVTYFDTEAAVKKSVFEDHGCDPARIVILEPETVEQFRNLALKVLEKYQTERTRPKMVMVLDSLGMLSSEKEMTDATEGNNIIDMTRAKAIRSTFRTLTLKLAKARVPLILTNHTYDGIGMYATKQVSGGGGLKYAASTIIMLSRKKSDALKEGTEVTGNIITARADKSRLSKENTSVELKLTYKNGLDRYYGLLDLAAKHGVIPYSGSRYTLPDGSKHFAKAIYGDPIRFFTQEIMDRLEQAAQCEFKYGKHRSSENDNDALDY